MISIKTSVYLILSPKIAKNTLDKYICSHEIPKLRYFRGFKHVGFGWWCQVWTCSDFPQTWGLNPLDVFSRPMFTWCLVWFHPFQTKFIDLSIHPSIHLSNLIWSNLICLSPRVYIYIYIYIYVCIHIHICISINMCM